MKRFVALLAFGLLAITACKPADQTQFIENDAMMDEMMENGMLEDDGMMNDQEEEMMEEDEMMDDGEEMMNGDMMDDGGDAMMEGENDMMEENAVAYTTFNSSVIGNGESSVLFFYAAWCPFCRNHDTKLQEWYSGDADLAYSVYKVDYDTETALRSRYGVVQQHTFVLIDGEGNLISLQSYPSDTGLLDLLNG